jgi:hypothetical protein
MDSGMPPEINEILQRSLDAAKDLQSCIQALPSVSTTQPKTIFEALVQAHTAHLLNHNAILKHATNAGSKGSASVAALHSMVAAGEQMIKEARSLHEYVIVSSPQQHLEQHGLDAGSLADMKSSAYKSPHSEVRSL